MSEQHISLLTLAVTAKAEIKQGYPVDLNGNVVGSTATRFGIAQADAKQGDMLAITVLGTAAVNTAPNIGSSGATKLYWHPVNKNWQLANLLQGNFVTTTGRVTANSLVEALL